MGGGAGRRLAAICAGIPVGNSDLRAEAKVSLENLAQVRAMNARVHLRLERPVLEFPRLNELVRSLADLLAALRRPTGEVHADIAWEDGEIDEGRELDF